MVMMIVMINCNISTDDFSDFHFIVCDIYQSFLLSFRNPWQGPRTFRCSSVESSHFRQSQQYHLSIWFLLLQSHSSHRQCMQFQKTKDLVCRTLFVCRLYIWLISDIRYEVGRQWPSLSERTTRGPQFANKLINFNKIFQPFPFKRAKAISLTAMKEQLSETFMIFSFREDVAQSKS